MAAGPDAAETLLGHAPGLASSYRKIEVAELVQLWKKHEIALHINISPEARIAIQTKDVNSAAIVELREENEKLTKKLVMITDYLKMMSGDMNDDADFLISHRIIDAKLKNVI